MENKKQVAIYIRVSTLDQAREGYSLDVQEKTLRKWCEERKYNVYDLYADKGISGKDIKHRPDINRLLNDAKMVNSIWFYFGRLVDLQEVYQIYI